jgi:hypothetical protein
MGRRHARNLPGRQATPPAAKPRPARSGTTARE